MSWSAVNMVLNLIQIAAIGVLIWSLWAPVNEYKTLLREIRDELRKGVKK